jgi:hypothetical protein
MSGRPVRHDDVPIVSFFLRLAAHRAGGGADLIETPIPARGLPTLRPSPLPPWADFLPNSAGSSPSEDSSSKHVGDAVRRRSTWPVDRAASRTGDVGPEDVPAAPAAIRSHTQVQLAHSLGQQVGSSKSEEKQTADVRTIDAAHVPAGSPRAKRASAMTALARMAAPDGPGAATSQRDSRGGGEGTERWKLELDCAWSSIPHPLKVHRGECVPCMLCVRCMLRACVRAVCARGVWCVKERGHCSAPAQSAPRRVARAHIARKMQQDARQAREQAGTWEEGGSHCRRCVCANQCQAAPRVMLR